FRAWARSSRNSGSPGDAATRFFWMSKPRRIAVFASSRSPDLASRPPRWSSACASLWRYFSSVGKGGQPNIGPAAAGFDFRVVTLLRGELLEERDGALQQLLAQPAEVGLLQVRLVSHRH